MAEGKTQPKVPTAQTVLVCRLRHQRERWGASPTAGEVELENVSADPVEIEGSLHPLQYLDLVVRDSEGGTVSARPYSNIFSPREKPYRLRLSPGEKYLHPVGLLGNVPPDRQKPGRYTVQAVYQYGDLRTVSEPLLVQL